MIRRLLSVMLLPAGLSLALLLANSASAAVTINFIELPNEGGIHVTTTDASVPTHDITKNAEPARVATISFAVMGSADLYMTHIGVTHLGPGFSVLVNILESPGGPLSDQIWLHLMGPDQFQNAATVIDFISDPSQFNISTSPAAIVEHGSQQQGLTYNDATGNQVPINFLSDTEGVVPEPHSLVIWGLLAGAGLFMTHVRRRRTAAWVR